ncbi:MAG: universal stress protein [Halobacteria archaeon]|nr:universal stress protein [Halobacteria archaeon]
MYSDILIPTDGSEGSEEAARHGFDIASKYDADVHALYVIDKADLPENMVGGIKRSGGKTVDKVVESAEERGINVRGEVRSGNPHEKILDYIEENKIDLVVMGTHGRTGVKRVLMGSVAEKVVRTSPVPVLTVRGLIGEVTLSQEAVRVAEKTLEEQGYSDAEIEEDAYRKFEWEDDIPVSHSWVVHAVREDGTELKIHVDSETGEADISES